MVASSAGFTGPGALRRFAALASEPGVRGRQRAVSGRVAAAAGARHDGGRRWRKGAAIAPAAVDQPTVLAGTWLRPGGVVVEHAFAGALGLHVGDSVTLDGQPFRVVGIARHRPRSRSDTQVCFYGGCRGQHGEPPSFDTGLIWLTQPAARRLATPGSPLTYCLNLRLADPAAAPVVRARAPAARPGRDRSR